MSTKTLVKELICTLYCHFAIFGDLMKQHLLQQKKKENLRKNHRKKSSSWVFNKIRLKQQVLGALNRIFKVSMYSKYDLNDIVCAFLQLSEAELADSLPRLT